MILLTIDLVGFRCLSGMTEPITKFVVLVLQHTEFVPQHIGSAILEFICLEKVIPIAKGSRFLKLGNWVGFTKYVAAKHDIAMATQSKNT